MNDFLGRELAIGDHFAKITKDNNTMYAKRYLAQCIVTRLTTKGIKYRYIPNGIKFDQDEHFICSSESIVRI